MIAQIPRSSNRAGKFSELSNKTTELKTLDL